MERPSRNIRSPRALFDSLQGWLDSRRGRRVLGMVAAGLAVAIVLTYGAGGAQAKPPVTGPLTIFANPVTPASSATTVPPVTRASVPPATPPSTTVQTSPPTTPPPTVQTSPPATFPPATSPPTTFPPATAPPQTAPPPPPPSTDPPDTGIVVP